MIADSIHFQGHRCFKGGWVGFDSISPINLIIGRNNTGKSHILDLVEALCSGSLQDRRWKYRCSGLLDQQFLRQQFDDRTSGGPLPGNHWGDHGQYFVGATVAWEIDEASNATNLEFQNGFSPQSKGSPTTEIERQKRILALLKNPSHVLSGKIYRRLLADRDVRPEEPQTTLNLSPNGFGASNIVRRFIVTSNAQYPREVIQQDLLRALSKIFGSDGDFTEIQVKFHDETDVGNLKDLWEIFLGERKKGLIPLSHSGSGLKTVFLVLLNLLVVPIIEGRPKSRFVFAFEELENNLHPALLRRLLQFIEEYAMKENAKVFLTTHSNVALDLFSISKNAQVIHVTHDGESARAAKVSAHFDRLGVISELGAKPSDLLQANGIIWVEGPSDCIYLNRWIDLFSGGKFQEGRDYQCAFYGGSLLARTQFASPEKAEKDLVNLFRVNPNIVVVCDGDRTAPGARVKDRVRRISAEVRKIPGAHVWVTGAREIENYLGGEVLAKATGIATLPDPTQYELFFPRKNSAGASYVESKMNRKGIDKMDLAVLSVPHIQYESIFSRFDLAEQMAELTLRIKAWNR